MSLPEITAPFGTPVFSFAGHGFTPKSVFVDVPMQVGHPRKTRITTRSPRVAAVQWVLTAAQMAAVDRWFETTLLVGSRQFAARVADLAPGLIWWTAEWVEPYRSEPLHSGMWRVTGNLLLTGDGSLTGPISTSAYLEFGAALVGEVLEVAPPPGSLEFGAALTQTALGRIEFGAALRWVSVDYLIREDGGYIRREDGGRIRRELRP